MADHNPMYSLPGGSRQLNTLLDTEKVPLLIASDIIIGETSMYADYIFPDISYLEQWGTGQMPNHYRVKTSSVRQPVIAPLTETVAVNGENLPICLETLMIAIAAEMKLPGFGQDGFGKDVALKRPEDWYLKLAANIAFGDKENETVPDADQKELSLFQESRRYLTDSVFSEANWKNALKPQEWRKVVYVLNRGGRFERSDRAYNSNQETYPFTGIMRFFLEEIGTSRHAMSGQYFNGHTVYEDIKDCMNQLVPVDGDYKLITFKEVFGTQSRTIADYWLETDIANQNFVLLNSQDAKQLSLKNGDKVRLSSQSNPQGIQDLGDNNSRYVEGIVKVKEGIRPGVVAVSTHYGHWAYGAGDVEIDGVVIHGDSRRGKGIHVNPILRLDDNLRGTPLSEPIGGSASFYDTWIKVAKV